MDPLNFPDYTFRLSKLDQTELIYDPIRKKNIVLTPEEWVRQHVIAFLVQTQKYPMSLIAVERMITFNRLKKRFDVLVYNKNGRPEILIECKAPEVKLSSETLFQISTYNMVYKVPYLFISNGMKHLLFQLNDAGNYISVEQFPVI